MLFKQFWFCKTLSKILAICFLSVFIFFRSVVRDLQQTEGQLVPRVKADLRCLSADPSGRPTGTTERRALPEPA